MKKLSKWLINNLSWLIVVAVGLLCAGFLLNGTPAGDGSITLDGENAKIHDYTEKFIEDANDALYRIMNEDAPTDEATVEEFEDGTGQGGSVTLDQVKSRRLADGDTDNGKGWQCSKYTAYLATGRREYSTSHPDYGPVNGKDVAKWLVDNFGWQYTDKPVEGAIGSGGFNTLYGHTAEYLYSTGTNTAMVSDANFVPLTVATHSLNITGWVWVVPPGSDTSERDEKGNKENEKKDVSLCEVWNVKRGDTMSGIMKACTGKVVYGEAMNEYARHWFSKLKQRSVFDGWNIYPGVGLYAGDTIEYRK